MSKRKISQRRDKYNSILKAIAEYTALDRKPLVRLLIRKGMTYQEIADGFGVTKQAVNDWLIDWEKQDKETNLDKVYTDLNGGEN